MTEQYLKLQRYLDGITDKLARDRTEKSDFLTHYPTSARYWEHSIKIQEMLFKVRNELSYEEHRRVTSDVGMLRQYLNDMHSVQLFKAMDRHKRR